MTLEFVQDDAIAIATAVRQQKVSASQIITNTLNRIDQRDKKLNCFTALTDGSALQQAEEIDRQIAQGQEPGPLAGVPFAVKNLFDIQGITTIAGSIIDAEKPSAKQDATVITRLKQAGAILVGALNMDEYAYGFVTENSHYGPVHNPHDLNRIAGGSSGGSGAAVAGGLVPLSLGSDTNGSIRVPAALCGIYGLKPTYGRLSRAGMTLFSGSLDHVGPLGRSVRDMAIAFDIMQGPDPRDPICYTGDPEPTLSQLNQGIDGLRIAVASGHFATGGEPEVHAAVEQVAKALSTTQTVTIPEAARARAAAYIITATEGANLHFADLKRRPQDFDPATRDRFLAGLFIPASWYIQAQRFRQWYRDRVRELFQTVDIIIAPTTPTPATRIGQQTLIINGEEVLLRPNLGLYTQPLSFIGLPVISVPLQPSQGLPVGVQLIAAPYQEASLLKVAAFLEAQGVTRVLSAKC
ncbi:Asp-tRNA(Asn)/Glu-tRNA(Gln) amidotransferase GatCAB subunit A [Desertifilum sp. FACHB-1129]|uniref:Amidase n=1 Tax=Desertifilum tharense IPPAS B-1220 TaxID=1781255 RepID=A0A1E5QJ33_9CYAN|nr:MULTISPECIES: Asp-tRNA(Asn)/Glu-tRNA(Gln) amidotransferase GatCAB subunit A [Desertifilum]MDA0212552.1 Asp-tRNA(Asn)/Glu-tRNA(Gln) amidotransferase GatCAB subunit A [Cyanobacteria bacterium FC1]MBD2314611.1 Asp-tRNA(Asn)/Glu-tRNA(Gln) amidotransferase GatCAB subunit A [Desertifilum sp. FACHB-1129]MBD2324970.1 Asp-tRNA(Asn)/Glu-tRNA(Gln) amidotransferase GatCAB subunit A [Desertifilum sp. FACHB-866]MBD2335109.1 Asp-tRNA(Asn)/Glu-tRNA(Gln) amidotransferase GatCAB subunit A [Desertifilum sp. FA